MIKQENYELNNGVMIPKVGFGTASLGEGVDATEVIGIALETGYRHLDTAQSYGTEKQVGQAIKASDIDRDKIFVTTKIDNPNHSYDLTMSSLEESLQKMQLEYIDLVLIHWPNPIILQNEGPDAWKKANQETWRAMEEMYHAGKIRALGVSNFMEHHIESILETAKVTPAVNQMYLAPGTPQTELAQFCKEKGIILEGYSPLGAGNIFDNQTVKEIAEKYNRSVAQIAIRWSLDKGYLPLPRSSKKDHIQNNFDVFDFTLEEEDITKLDNIEGIGSQADPDKATH